MSDAKLVEFEKVAKEEGVIMGFFQSQFVGKPKYLRITKNGACSFADITKVTDTDIFRRWIKHTFPN